MASSDTIAPELVSHDHSRDVLQTLQKPPEEALGGVGIAPGLNEDVEHNAILIDDAPEVMLQALDPDEDFVHVPLIPWPRSAAAQAFGKEAEPLEHGAVTELIGDRQQLIARCIFSFEYTARQSAT